MSERQQNKKTEALDHKRFREPNCQARVQSEHTVLAEEKREERKMLNLYSLKSAYLLHK